MTSTIMEPISPTSSSSTSSSMDPPPPSPPRSSTTAALVCPTPSPDAPFPSKLHEMLEYAEKTGLGSVVSWLPNGRAFKIYKNDPFMTDVANRFFRATKLRSIHRQLNLWGFTRIPSGEEKDSWHHPHFLRDKPEDMRRMVRTKVKRVPDKPKPIKKVTPNLQQSSSLSPRSPSFLQQQPSSAAPTPLDMLRGMTLGEIERRFREFDRTFGNNVGLKIPLTVNIPVVCPQRPRRVSVTSPTVTSSEIMTQPEFVASAAAAAQPRRFSAPLPGTIRLARRDRYGVDADQVTPISVPLPPFPLEPMPFGAESSPSVLADPSGVDEFSLFIDRMIQEPIDELRVEDPF